ncbi:Putative mitochondrial ribosomal protein, L17 [Trichuris trichiura]|uniref:Putative mitochondrial ribosomal protein, L17 n=1 Tax=Trichuris trichiura TaxID=36087 RepID=A0A077ZEP3_TRITR|nr:Putative mitochondrial ribosomal protein, L17 [Trichuris trichiura]
MEAFNDESTPPQSGELYNPGEDTFDAKVLRVRWRLLDDTIVFEVNLGKNYILRCVTRSFCDVRLPQEYLEQFLKGGCQ